VQHKHLRRILDRRASRALFEMLVEPSRNFRLDLLKGGIRHRLRGDRAGNGRLYLNIGHTGLNQPGFRTWVQEAQVRPIYFVHDLIPIAHPEYCREGEHDRHVERMRTVLQTATGVIGNSQATVDDLGSFAEKEQLPRPPAVAAWLGTTELSASTSPPPELPTFVTLGTIEARKNHILLLGVWERLVRRLSATAPRLVVVGQRGWEADKAIDLLQRQALGDAVIEAGGCDDAELARYLRSARALLFPSLAEGFGMPLVEALQAGVPVIASDLPVFREIGQGIPDFIDAQDDIAWEEAILDYADESSVRREAQMKRLPSFKPPTWDDHFAKVDAWLGTL
jgi:glycosyltransferase involved in cell wall biosynthesis